MGSSEFACDWPITDPDGIPPDLDTIPFNLWEAHTGGAKGVSDRGRYKSTVLAMGRLRRVPVRPL